MNIQEIISVAGAIILSVGGAGGIILAISGFISKRIANYIDEKYKQRLSKELERYKSSLDNCRYITKAQFDKEFEIYHLLSKAYFSMIVLLSSFTHDSLQLKELPEENVKMKIDEFMRMGESVAIAQNTLFENAAFIPENLYEKYEEIYEKAIDLFWVYEKRLREFSFGNASVESLVTSENKTTMELINTDFSELNKQLREYLNKLNIVE